MKKLLCVISMVSFLLVSVSAQGLYFDAGLGIGKAETEFNGTNIADSMDSSVRDIGVGLGLKIGYGPICDLPIYIIGEISGIGHRLEDDYNYMQFNSYLVGPGIIIYPISIIQLGASFGISYVANETDLPFVFYESEKGYAGNIYCALDFGKDDQGCLVGVQYSKTVNTLEISGAEQNTTLVSIFVKYTFRHKK